MLLVHYLHRLPTDYELSILRKRAKERGPVWDAAPDLYFKAFLLRTSGQHGARETSYSSLYLWRGDQAFANFLLSGRYGHVTRSFGRAGIDAHVVLAARPGRGHGARFLIEETVHIGGDVDLERVLAQEPELTRAAAALPGTVAAVSAVDTQRWCLKRYRLAEDLEVPQETGALVYEVAHLSQPLLHSLQVEGLT
ncbi:DUF4865 family protein [Paucibacter sp. R3-3]|uniref:DUF4865 family protein n=1 Tax=Roseateles agri TaxID=3098619 RepID=A0ABU5DNH0_9BURK|nr:DUF4865 family protein [Paucibacter sp. R3-3]MDY0747684.1 DUF4865 family protein [Paucibacter sp. R3-3]